MWRRRGLEIELTGGCEDELFSAAAGGQFGAAVLWCGFRSDVGGRLGLEWAGARVGLCGVVIFVGDVWVDGAGLARSGIGRDDGCGSSVCGVVECGGGACDGG